MDEIKEGLKIAAYTIQNVKSQDIEMLNGSKIISVKMKFREELFHCPFHFIIYAIAHSTAGTSNKRIYIYETGDIINLNQKEKVFIASVDSPAGKTYHIFEEK